MSKRYDTVDTRGDEQETVVFLARLAARQDALEFAMGTGRIALPLAMAGVRVDGIEQSVHRPRPGPAASMSTSSTSQPATSCWTSAGTTP